MTIGVFTIGVLAGVLGATAVAAPKVAADEIKVLAPGAFKPVVTELAADFEHAGGGKIRVENASADMLTRRIDDGETFDLAVLTPDAMRGLAERGKIVAGSTKQLARVGLGVAIKEGAPKPDITTADELKKALLAARAVAYVDPASGGSSGVYLTKLFERLGIADAIKAKAVLVTGGLAAERVVSGDADLAIQQISELHGTHGVTVLGPLPADLQSYTVYAGGVGTSARNPTTARKLLDLLAGPDGRAVLKRLGMEPPGGLAGG
jgi:molybdate transport system substrate-binding protein